MPTATPVSESFLESRLPVVANLLAQSTPGSAEVRKEFKAPSRDQHPDYLTAHYAPCAEPRHFRPSGTSWAPLGGVNRRETT
jgi:hypothetical protein